MHVRVPSRDSKETEVKRVSFCCLTQRISAQVTQVFFLVKYGSFIAHPKPHADLE